MPPEPDDVRNRAWTERRRPPHGALDDAMWVAEDPVTGCVGVGRVESEAVGNLVSVVVERDRAGDSDEPLMKLPGRVVNRPAPRTDEPESLLDRILSRL